MPPMRLTPMLVIVAALQGCAVLDTSTMSDFDVCFGASTHWGNGVLPQSSFVAELQKRGTDCTSYSHMIEQKQQQARDGVNAMMSTIKQVSDDQARSLDRSRPIACTSIPSSSGVVHTHCQ